MARRAGASRMRGCCGTLLGVISVTTLIVLGVGPARIVVAAMRTLQGSQPVYPVDAARAQSNARKSGVTRTLYGITPFPYDDTLDAVTRTKATIVPNSTLYPLHFDDGIPWKEALADAPFPARIRKEWEATAAGIPPDHVVYLGLAPLATDRKSLAPATGEEKRPPMPEELKSAALDDPLVRRAYLNYARRAVRTFHPRYLNLGIEAGELMSRDFARWPQFVRLYSDVHDALKREFPDMQIGISFGLGDLRAEREAKAALPLIEKSDYVGLSFYPYASPFDEMFGAPAYGSGPDAWRKPLGWIRAYTDKPIAICETGYSTKSVDIPQFGLNMPVKPEHQAQYVRELFEISRRDRYAFVVWFLAIDYEKLYAKLPPGSDAMKLWLNIGMLDGEARPKPAWEIWKAGVAASR